MGRGGAAAGGAGRGGGGAPFGGAAFGGAPFGGCLGFPSGPSSPAACAITSGAVCACDGALTNCIAVRAVVASSTSRSFVMMVLVPRKIFGRKVWRYTNKPRAALWRPENADSFIFCRTESLDSPLFIAHSGDGFKPQRYIVPCGISDAPGLISGSKPGRWSIPASVAGDGVCGPCGPRTGNSFGCRPGNSSGCGASPGSRIGGGTSGCGLPGGLSCGGSDGCPGLIGGSSFGSIPIYIATLRLSPR